MMTTEMTHATTPRALRPSDVLGPLTAGCSALCADSEPCSVSADGKCIGWWSDEAWQASAETGAAMDEKRLAFKRYLSHPDGSDERKVEWQQWKVACNRQRAAEARFAAAVASGPNVVVTRRHDET